MGIVRPLPELEAWLDSNAGEWKRLSDHDYLTATGSWEERFRGAIERGEQHQSGHRARDAFDGQLPTDVYLLSGIVIPRIGNTGGDHPSCYHVAGLATLDYDLAARLELIVVAADISWCLLLSHFYCPKFP